MSAKTLVDRQAEDAGLWFDAVTAPESYLQSALRALHAEVEREAGLLADAPGATVIGWLHQGRFYDTPESAPKGAEPLFTLD